MFVLAIFVYAIIRGRCLLLFYKHFSVFLFFFIVFMCMLFKNLINIFIIAALSFYKKKWLTSPDVTICACSVFCVLIFVC